MLTIMPSHQQLIHAIRDLPAEVPPISSVAIHI
jgi:hypothetical protein